MLGNRSRDNIKVFIKSFKNGLVNVVSYYQHFLYLSNTSTANWRKRSFANWLIYKNVFCDVMTTKRAIRR